MEYLVNYLVTSPMHADNSPATTRNPFANTLIKYLFAGTGQEANKYRVVYGQNTTGTKCIPPTTAHPLYAILRQIYAAVDLCYNKAPYTVRCNIAC